MADPKDLVQIHGLLHWPLQANLQRHKESQKSVNIRTYESALKFKQYPMGTAHNTRQQ